MTYTNEFNKLKVIKLGPGKRQQECSEGVWNKQKACAQLEEKLVHD